MSYSYHEEKTETGKKSELPAIDAASADISEPTMRYWQLSEAHARMARRIKKRRPDIAKVLARLSEDMIINFYEDVLQANLQQKVGDRIKSHNEEVKEQERRYPRAESSERIEKMREQDSGQKKEE